MLVSYFLLIRADRMHSFLPAGAVRSPPRLLAVRWIDLGTLPPALLVGSAAQGLQLFMRTHNGTWGLAVRAQHGGLTGLSIGGPGEGCLAFAASGRHVLSMTDMCRSACVPSVDTSHQICRMHFCSPQLNFTWLKGTQCSASERALLRCSESPPSLIR